MKVKNIAFSGFAAAILATTVANAAATVQVASKQYVDNKVEPITTNVQNLQTTLAQKADASALESLATKDELDAKVDASALESLATKDELGQKVDASALESLATKDELDGYAKTSDVASAYVTKDELGQKADKTALESLATKDALNAEVGALTTALNDKVNATTVEEMIDLAIPKPTGSCTAESGRCVLSIDTDNSALMWLDVTKPLE